MYTTRPLYVPCDVYLLYTVYYLVYTCVMYTGVYQMYYMYTSVYQMYMCIVYTGVMYTSVYQMYMCMPV